MTDDATRLLVNPGPTRTHRYACLVNHSAKGLYATLLGWAETPMIAERARREFEASERADVEELLSPQQSNPSPKEKDHE